MDPALAPTSQLGPFAIGALLAGRYEITAPLGEGGMGAVYRARDRALDEEIALKVLRAELAGNAEALGRFHREVKLARRVTHPNVARTYDLGLHEGTRFITMELIVGESLATASRRGVALPEVLRIAEEACHGLVAAHAVGVVHRDLKPDNVMLAGQRVKLTDFGIARALGGEDAHTVNGIVGTPAYMAPEQVEGKAIDGRTDVYAFGVMLFELVTGRLPWEGDSPFALAAARLLRVAPSARDLSPELPAGVDALLARMLARRREERPDAASVASELEQLRGVRARAAGSFTLSLETPAAVERTIVLRRLEGEPAELVLALESALGDALASAKGLTVTQERASPGASGELAICGSVRAVGEAVRVRVRLVEPLRGVTTWAEQLDGSTRDPFALEDALIARVVPAIVHRCGGGAGPSEPGARARWEEARALYSRVTPESVRGAVVLLEDILASDPKSPWAMALLALCSIRAFYNGGGQDQSLVGRAEELALRAIDLDPRVADAYYAVALVRSVMGDYRGVIHAHKEALRRNPLLADAHAGLASVLTDIGRLEEALQRVDVAIRLNPSDLGARSSRIRTLALLGRVEEATRELDLAHEGGGGASVAGLEARLVFWWGSRERAGVLVERMQRYATNAAWALAIPALAAFARGEADPDAARRLDPMVQRSYGAGRGNFVQIAAEYFGAVGARDEALRYLSMAEPSAFWGLAWLDHCPAIALIRDAPEFAALRANTAERVAQLLA